MEEETVVPTKKKSAPKMPKEPTEKKRKAPKAASSEVQADDNPESTTVTDTADQEVPVKAKKKRAPKAETMDEPLPVEEPVKKKKSKVPKIESTDDPLPIDEPVKKKKSKAPKPVSIDDIDLAPVESAPFDDFEPLAEPKRKEKKSKKSKKTPEQSFEDIQDTPIESFDGHYSENTGAYTEPTDETSGSNTNSSDYERAIIDSFSNLAAKVNFTDYVGNDQWCIIHPPKSARTEPKSRLRKMLPGGGGKDEKSGGKPAVPKGSLLTRFRNGMSTLVRNENNLLFGERSNYELGEMEDEEDGVDTDNLHRYAQKLRELEDQDREINPEYLVLRDGKTVYGVHESDADGKVKLSTRKPIYDRQADQKPDDLAEKKGLLAKLKMPFGRNKDKDDKDSKSANATPDARIRRKTSRKSLNDDFTAGVINDDPLKI